MTIEKFETELQILQKFFHYYCTNKHEEQFEKSYKLTYKHSSMKFQISLCQECHTLLDYSLQRLIECPHEIKPRCRKCPNPCYEKKQWRTVARVMRYSAIRMGLIKFKKFILH